MKAYATLKEFGAPLPQFGTAPIRVNVMTTTS
jgi:hypothetical protein